MNPVCRGSPFVSSRSTVSSNFPSLGLEDSISRSFLIFPIQLDQTKLPRAEDSDPFSSYSTKTFKLRYCQEPNLSGEFKEIYIKGASYLKQKQSPRHEFIVFEVMSTKSNMRNFIALDRNVEATGWIGSSGLIPGSNRSCLPAKDSFHVSHRGDIESFIRPSGGKTFRELCTHVEQATFKDNSFTFAELVVLASTVSEWCPNYQLNNTNCYWFASSIWECMLNLFTTGVDYHGKYSKKQGQFKGIKFQRPHYFGGILQKCYDDIKELVYCTQSQRISDVHRGHGDRWVPNSQIADSSVAASSASHCASLSSSTFEPSLASETTNVSHMTRSAVPVSYPRESMAHSESPEFPCSHCIAKTTGSTKTACVQIPAIALAVPHLPPSADSQNASTIPGSASTPCVLLRESISSEISPKMEPSGDQALRSQARLEGDKMNMMFAATQQAHECGELNRAEQLLNLGWEYHERMSKLHEDAMKLVSKEPNEHHPVVSEPAKSDIARPPGYETRKWKVLESQARQERDRMVTAFAACQHLQKEGMFTCAEQLSDLALEHQRRMHTYYEVAARVFKKHSGEHICESSLDPFDVSPEYVAHNDKALRAQVRLEGDKFAMLCMASQQALDAGNPSIAKQLLGLGFEHQKRMRQFHEDAASFIFEANNSEGAVTQFDISGLYVQEAIFHLFRYLQDALVAGQVTVRIITGTGIYPQGSSKIVNAVMESLCCQGLRHYTDSNDASIIVVELTSAI